MGATLRAKSYHLISNDFKRANDLKTNAIGVVGIVVLTIAILTTGAGPILAQDVAPAQEVLPAQEAMQDVDAASPLDYPGSAWSPYLVGALIGLLSMATFYFSNKPLGASSAYAVIAGRIGMAVAPRRTSKLEYFAVKKPTVGWQVMLVGGVMVGAFLAALHGGELTGQLLPAFWSDRFGDSSAVQRIVSALVGGLCMAFGARMAGGCTSGHGISGTLQLSIGSWIAAVCFFIGGVATAWLIYG